MATKLTVNQYPFNIDTVDLQLKSEIDASTVDKQLCVIPAGTTKYAMSDRFYTKINQKLSYISFNDYYAMKNDFDFISSDNIKVENDSEKLYWIDDRSLITNTNLTKIDETAHAKSNMTSIVDDAYTYMYIKATSDNKIIIKSNSNRTYSSQSTIEYECNKKYVLIDLQAGGGGGGTSLWAVGGRGGPGGGGGARVVCLLNLDKIRKSNYGYLIMCGAPGKYVSGNYTPGSDAANAMMYLIPSATWTPPVDMKLANLPRSPTWLLSANGGKGGGRETSGKGGKGGTVEKSTNVNLANYLKILYEASGGKGGDVGDGESIDVPAISIHDVLDSDINVYEKAVAYKGGSGNAGGGSAGGGGASASGDGGNSVAAGVGDYGIDGSGGAGGSYHAFMTPSGGGGGNGLIKCYLSDAIKL